MTATDEVSSRTTMVVGASRGLGRGIATAFAHAGDRVIAVARTAAGLAELAATADNIEPEVADAAEATVPARLIDRHGPQAIIVVAGATPHMRPVHQQTWETFSIHWNTDVRIAFHWLRETLLTPLRPGSRVVVVSSGAAARPTGSPLSGGYAGAKATERFILGYAQEEADRAALGITYTDVLPQFAPETGVGRAAVRAYAAQTGQPVEQFLHDQQYPLLTPQIAGAAVLDLVQADATTVAPAYLLNGAGLHRLP
jgi:3-oxoacyl-[acyl-carrier protein] reductase